MKALIIASLLVLGACAGTTDTRVVNALAIACDTYATALEQLTPHKDAMSLDQVARVDASNAIVDPVCLPGAVIDPRDGVFIVRQGVALLQNLSGAV